jgi:hypothetical protein
MRISLGERASGGEPSEASIPDASCPCGMRVWIVLERVVSWAVKSQTVEDSRWVPDRHAIFRHGWRSFGGKASAGKRKGGRTIYSNVRRTVTFHSENTRSPFSFLPSGFTAEPSHERVVHVAHRQLQVPPQSWASCRQRAPP